MKTPLIFVVVSLLFAQEKPLPYPQVFEKGVLAVRQAFAKGEILPEVPKPIDPEDQKKYGAQYENFNVLATQAGFIQSGRSPDDDIESWHLMIDHVAVKMGLNVEKAWKLYGHLVRPSSSQNGESSLPEAVLRAGLLGEILSEAKVSPQAQKELSGKMTAIRGRLEKSLLGDPGLVDSVIAKKTTYGNPTDLKSIPPQVKPLPFKTNEPPGLGAKLLSFIDSKRANELAEAAEDNARQFGGWCYRVVKSGLKTILPEKWHNWLYQDQGHAYKFAENLRENPKMLDKLKLRKLTPEQVSNGVPPVGSIVVFGRGVCGFSAKSGHIEIRVAGEPPRYCSDGCTTSENRQRCIKANLGKKDRVNVYVPAKDEAGS